MPGEPGIPVVGPKGSGFNRWAIIIGLVLLTVIAVGVVGPMVLPGVFSRGAAATQTPAADPFDKAFRDAAEADAKVRENLADAFDVEWRKDMSNLSDKSSARAWVVHYTNAERESRSFKVTVFQTVEGAYIVVLD